MAEPPLVTGSGSQGDRPGPRPCVRNRETTTCGLSERPASYRRHREAKEHLAQNGVLRGEFRGSAESPARLSRPCPVRRHLYPGISRGYRVAIPPPPEEDPTFPTTQTVLEARGVTRHPRPPPVAAREPGSHGPLHRIGLSEVRRPHFTPRRREIRWPRETLSCAPASTHDRSYNGGRTPRGKRTHAASFRKSRIKCAT